MSTIITQSELTRRAVAWIHAEKQSRPLVSIQRLVDEAGMRFNLSPKDCHTVLQVFTPRTPHPPSDPDGPAC